ncbi:MAG: cysteine hydrolase, partial [Cephaloticoccus sp.]|nr:cysteine hydrolase [Cephaloticoccus sp.]
MSRALLIIDVQQALCTGPEAAFDIDRVIARINTLAKDARAARLPVILIQHEENEGALQSDSAGWRLATALITSPGDLRVRKKTPDSFHHTDLQRLLEARQVDHLIICGLQSDYCVDTTTRRALALGYAVTLVADAHSTIDTGVLTAAQITAHHNQTLRHLHSFGP